MGKSSGLVRGLKTPIQQGDISDILWRGRTAEQLGTFKIENIFSPFTHVFKNHLGILAIESACTMCQKGMPEKAPHPDLFRELSSLLLSISSDNWLTNYVFFEVKFLSEVGIGLDLSKCAVTGNTDDLFYVSPVTGRAVTQKTGEPYKDRLFVLPKFLICKDKAPASRDVLYALKITGHFLKMYFCGIDCNELPLSRGYLISEIAKNAEER
jgi:DNA repair protein RecO (recombination protein O)